jgi:hypothetical protein
MAPAQRSWFVRYWFYMPLLAASILSLLIASLCFSSGGDMEDLFRNPFFTGPILLLLVPSVAFGLGVHLLRSFFTDTPDADQEVQPRRRQRLGRITDISNFQRADSDSAH